MCKIEIVHWIFIIISLPAPNEICHLNDMKMYCVVQWFTSKTNTQFAFQTCSMMNDEVTLWGTLRQELDELVAKRGFASVIRWVDRRIRIFVFIFSEIIRSKPDFMEWMYTKMLILAATTTVETRHIFTFENSNFGGIFIHFLFV